MRLHVRQQLVDRRGASAVLGLAFVCLIGSACGSRVNRAELEAVNGSFTGPELALSNGAGPVREASQASPSDSAGVNALSSGGVTADTSARPAVSSGLGTASVAQRSSAPSPGAASPAAGPAGSARAGSGHEPPSGSSVPAAATAPRLPETRSPVLLGSFGVESGILGAVTAPAPPAIRAWQAWVNSRGGLNGHPVRIILADDGGDPYRAQTVVRRMVEQDKVIAFFTEYSINTLAAVTPYLEQKQIPVLGSIGADLDGNRSPIVFNPLLGASALGHGWGFLRAVETLSDKKNLGIVYCREATGCKDFADGLKKLVPYQGIHTVYEAQVSLAQPDYTAEMVQAQRAGADVLFVLLDASAIARLANSAHRQGYSPLLGSAYNLSTAEALRYEELNGTLISLRFPPWDSSPKLQDYRDAMAQYQPSGQRGDVGAGAFVMGKLLQEKITPFLQEPPTSAQLLQGLYALNNETLGGLLPGVTFNRGSHERVNLCTVPVQLEKGRQVTRNGAEAFVCAPDWAPGGS